MSRASAAVRPGDCSFVIGLPTTRAEYELCKDGKRPSSFVREQCPSWLKFQRDIEIPFQRVLPRIEEFGGHVVRGATLDALRREFEASRTAVILFAHWTEQGVEFSDQVAGIQDIIDCVPHGFDGIVDLCVCHPRPLVLSLKSARPRSLVKFVNIEAVIPYWIHLYLVMMSLIAQSPHSYQDALDLSIKRLVNR